MAFPTVASSWVGRARGRFRFHHPSTASQKTISGGIRTVAASVRVSGRRFLARPIYYALIMNLLPLAYRLGIPANTLAHLYGHRR